jgi:hypothetical protein
MTEIEGFFRFWFLSGWPGDALVDYEPEMGVDHQFAMSDSGL